jgi:hypothetical protein
VNQLLEMLDSASQQLRLVCGLFGEEVSVSGLNCVNLSIIARPRALAHARRDRHL